AELCREIDEAKKNGERESDAVIQERLTPFARAVTKTYGIGGLKAAMELAGYEGGRVRAPLSMPNDAACAEIESLLRDATAASESRRIGIAVESRLIGAPNNHRVE